MQTSTYETRHTRQMQTRKGEEQTSSMVFLVGFIALAAILVSAGFVMVDGVRLPMMSDQVADGDRETVAAHLAELADRCWRQGGDGQSSQVIDCFRVTVTPDDNTTESDVMERITAFDTGERFSMEELQAGTQVTVKVRYDASGVHITRFQVCDPDKGDDCMDPACTCETGKCRPDVDQADRFGCVPRDADVPDYEPEPIDDFGDTDGDGGGTDGDNASDGTDLGNSTGGVTRDTFKIREGTDEETTVHTITAEADGPTVMVVGGMHGNEQNGWRAASTIASDWKIDAGKLVVIPKANIQAVEQDVRGVELAGGGSQTDLNRHFPAGQDPTSLLAQELWNVVGTHNPDLVIDLHSSRGLHDRSYEHECGGSDNVIPDSVGMAVFPTQAGDAQSPSRDVVNYLNNNHWPDSLPSSWQFVYGGASSDGSSPMLKHKVAADRGTPAVIFETFDYYYSCVDLDTQVTWTKEAVKWYLEHYGLIRSEP